jgi:hypothetical protein
MRLVIKDDIVIAQHKDDQEITLAMYPGSTEIKTVRDDLEVMSKVIVNEGLEDEREEFSFKTVTELGLLPEDEKVVRVIDGGKISQETLDELNAASTIAALRTVVLKILTGTP